MRMIDKDVMRVYRQQFGGGVRRKSGRSRSAGFTGQASRAGRCLGPLTAMRRRPVEGIGARDSPSHSGRLDTDAFATLVARAAASDLGRPAAPSQVLPAPRRPPQSEMRREFVAMAAPDNVQSRNRAHPVTTWRPGPLGVAVAPVPLSTAGATLTTPDVLFLHASAEAIANLRRAAVRSPTGHAWMYLGADGLRHSAALEASEAALALPAIAQRLGAKSSFAETAGCPAALVRALPAPDAPDGGPWRPLCSAAEVLEHAQTALADGRGAVFTRFVKARGGAAWCARVCGHPPLPAHPLAPTSCAPP